MKFTEFYQLFIENTTPRPYACLMLDLGFLLPDFQKIQEKICPCDVYDLTPGHGLEQKPHITVKYGLHDQNFSFFEKKLKFEPITFSLTNISLFRNKAYDVLKFDVKSKSLMELNDIITNNFDATDSYPKYHPHSTIGYLLPGKGEQYTKIKTDIIGKTFTSNRFVFSNNVGNETFKTVI